MSLRFSLIAVVLTGACSSGESPLDLGAGVDLTASTPMDLLVPDLASADDASASGDGSTGHANPRKLDLLFMVDNSSSMDPMQSLLRNELAMLLQPIDGLASDGIYVDLHIGVVTSDYGAGDTKGGGCDASPGGQNGILQTVPSPKATNPPANCMPPVGASYIQYAFGPSGATTNLPNGSDQTALANELTCMASVGAAGCGFEHQLESVYAALHNTSENAGFLRDDALLAVVFLTNEDDGSAAPTAQFYEPNNDPFGTSMYGQYNTFRQTRFAIECNGMQVPYDANSPPLSNCAGEPNPTMSVSIAYDVSRYVRYFANPRAQGGVKIDPGDVVLVAIDAPETPFETILVDPSQGATPYHACPSPALSQSCIQALQHSCENSAQPSFFGDPAVRLNAVVRSAATNTILSICGANLNAAPDYSGALNAVASLIRSRI